MTDQQMYVFAGLMCLVPHFEPRVSLVLGALFLCIGVLS
jgi:hypothetical protein